MSLFGASKRARAAEDASDVAIVEELKSWIAERDDKMTRQMVERESKMTEMLGKLMAKMDRVSTHVMKLDGACDKQMQVSNDVADQLRQTESKLVQNSMRTEAMSQHLSILIEEVRHLKLSLTSQVQDTETKKTCLPEPLNKGKDWNRLSQGVDPEEETKKTFLPEPLNKGKDWSRLSQGVDPEEECNAQDAADFEDMSIRDLNDDKIEALSDLASGADSMRLKSRPALERELRSTRAALRRALEAVKSRENQVGALEMISRRLHEQVIESDKSGSKGNALPTPWTIGDMSDSFSGIAGAFSGGLTGRPNQPAGADRKSWEQGSMMQLPTPGAHTERSPLRHSVLGDTINKNDVPDTPSLTQKEDSKDTHHVSSLSDRVGTVPRRSERGAMERFDVIERLHHASQLHGLSGPPPEKPKNQTSSQYSTRSGGKGQKSGNL